VKTIMRKCKEIKSKQYFEKSIEEFKCLLNNKESWQEVFQTSEVNSALQVFMDHLGYYFNMAFPYKLINCSKTCNSKWITKGIKISSKRMRFLNSVQRKFTLSREAQAYLFNILTHAHTIYILKCSKIHIKNTSKLAPTCFSLIFKTIFRGLVNSTLPSY
jgi:hypothetical protein